MPKLIPVWEWGTVNALELFWVCMLSIGILFVLWALYDARLDQRVLIESGQNGARRRIAQQDISMELYHLAIKTALWSAGVYNCLQPQSIPGYITTSGLYTVLALIIGAALLVGMSIYRRINRHYLMRYYERQYDEEARRER